MTQWTDYPGDLATWLSTCSRCGKETERLFAEVARLTAELAQTRLRHAELETIAKAERDALAAENHNLSSHYEAFQRELRAERAKVQALTDVVDRVRAIQKAGYDMPHREVMAWIEDALAPMSRLAAIGDGDNT